MIISRCEKLCLRITAQSACALTNDQLSFTLQLHSLQIYLVDDCLDKIVDLSHCRSIHSNYRHRFVNRLFVMLEA